jgi:hypothetical protein
VLDTEPAFFVRGSLHGDGTADAGRVDLQRNRQRVSGANRMKYGLLWLIGVPIPILIIAFLLFH